MRLAATSFIFLGTGLLAGCMGNSGDQDARDYVRPVLAKVENPSNGQADFTSSAAELIQDQCGLFRRSCRSVRIIDETGYANSQGGRLFTYSGTGSIAIAWKNSSILVVHCGGCDQGKIVRKLNRVNFTKVEYEMQAPA